MSPDRRNNITKIVIPLAIWLAVWQFAAMGMDSKHLLPSPVDVCRSLISLAGDAKFWLSALYSLFRILLGLFGGALAGFALAFLTHFVKLADTVLSPAIRVLRATPVVSFILLIYLWVSRANIPSLISGLMVLPVVWSNITAGLSAVDGQLLEMAKAYRFSRLKTLWLIYLPSLRSHISSCILTSFGLAWKSGVTAEVICPPKYAIGTQLKQARDAIETPDLFAWTVVIILLSLLLEAILRRLLRKGEVAG